MTDNKAEDKLPPDMKAQWLEALRSGKYQQGKSWLCYDGKHCCLGVLQEVIGKDVFPKHPRDWEYLDYEKAARLGLGERQQSMLARLNDRMEGFGPVANYIEKNL